MFGVFGQLKYHAFAVIINHSKSIPCSIHPLGSGLLVALQIHLLFSFQYFQIQIINVVIGLVNHFQKVFIASVVLVKVQILLANEDHLV